jgi:hypothetical protein
MADFDESAIRSPRLAGETIRPGEVAPWMVWSAAAALAALAVIGLFLGLRGRPTEGVALALTSGAAVNPAAVASATPAAPMPKDAQWSILSGTEIRPKPVVAPRSTAGEGAGSGEEASAEPAAAAAAETEASAAPAAAPAPQPAAPTAETSPAPDAQPGGPPN